VLLVAVAAAVYVFGRNHSPNYSGTGLFGRTAQATLPLKSWLATGVLGLAVFQVGSALWMYQVLPGLGAALRPVPRRTPWRPDVLARLAAGEDVDPSEYTFRTSVTIETADPALTWVNDGVFIAVGGRWPSGVSYDVYLVA
jgi:hypothetical protein